MTAMVSPGAPAGKCWCSNNDASILHTTGWLSSVATSLFGWQTFPDPWIIRKWRPYTADQVRMAVRWRTESMGARLAYNLQAIRPLSLWRTVPLQPQLPLVALYKCYAFTFYAFNRWISFWCFYDNLSSSEKRGKITASLRTKKSNFSLTNAENKKKKFICHEQ